MRVGERGAGEFREIEWEEAIATALSWLKKIRAEDPKKLAFFTGRDQSQSLTGFWATQFGTPNFAAHGGFCSVNMAAAGMYTIGGSFWEFGEPDWERTRLFLMFGVAEDHDSNPIKLALSSLRRRGAKFISVNPVRTGYSAIADEWLGIRPGTDGLFVLSLIHELLRNDKVDLAYLGRYTNAAWLVIRDPGAADDGLFARNEAGDPLVLGRDGDLASAKQTGVDSRIVGEATLPDGRRAVPVFQLLAERYLDPQYAPEKVGPVCGIPAERIRSLAQEMAQTAFEQEIELAVPWTDWAGRQHASMRGRPVSIHAMRGISAHSNGFRPAPRCIYCRFCWARSMSPAAGATNLPTRSRRRPDRNRPASRARSTRVNRSPARRSAIRWGRKTCCSMPRATRSALTRRSPGRRRSPPM